VGVWSDGAGGRGCWHLIVWPLAAAGVWSLAVMPPAVLEMAAYALPADSPLPSSPPLPPCPASLLCCAAGR
jgi:hypothetical protein